MNIFQEMQGRNLPEGFAWLNEPENWGFGPEGLEIMAPPASDFFHDPEGPRKGSAPFLFTEIKGDFIITTKVEVEMAHMFDSGCLMLMSDTDHWAKLCYENWLNEPAIVSVVTRNLSDDCPSLRIGKVKPYLKILRSGNCFGFYYSLDGKCWTLIRFFGMDFPETIKAGVVAQSPVGDGCRVCFEFLDLEQKKVESAKFVPADSR